MDVNGDGKLDVLSGSYSHFEQPMAGLFQVLYGEDEGKFRAAEPLKGSDGELLLIPYEDDQVTDGICTRPTAVDYDGDGHLDIVSGNFAGTFFLFKGEGAGTFAPSPSPLHDRSGALLKVDMHSDPVFFDWDGDGDLDIVSGSAMGGVFLATNVGTRKEPSYDAFAKLIAPSGGGHGGESKVMPDDSHLETPSSGTRVWVDDVNGDGKADLLVGDQVTVITPKDGVELAEAQKRYDEMQERIAGIWPRFVEGKEPSQEEMEAASKKYEELREEMAQWVDERTTGFVWAYYRK